MVLVIRMLPLPANFEPITATLMPYSRRMSVWVSVAMAFLSIFLYDIISGSFGSLVDIYGGELHAFGVVFCLELEG